MSSTSSVQLTEEQEKFLKDLEEEFRDRYTENDEEFRAVLSRKLPPPPVVENWGEFRPRGERGERGERAEYGRIHRAQNCERRRERYWRDDGERYSPLPRQDCRYRMRR